ncbi:MAG: 50S ribosomal protein L16 [Phycisphaerae bacterium]|nr:50S ribosomal protein L16 [Phycisphaerae bacterium]
MAFGEFGLQTLERGRISAQQIEAGRVAVTHHLHREGRVYIRIFPDKPVSKKPLEVRMGKGKGEPDHYVAVVKPGTVLFEIGGVEQDMAVSALARVAHKLPVKTRLVQRRHTM